MKVKIRMVSGKEYKIESALEIYDFVEKKNRKVDTLNEFINELAKTGFFVLKEEGIAINIANIEEVSEVV